MAPAYFTYTQVQRFGMLMHVESRATETSQSADFDSGGFTTFTNKFRYLGTIISSDLRNCPDIDRSSFFCNEKQLSPIIRRRLFKAMSWTYGAVKLQPAQCVMEGYKGEMPHKHKQLHKHLDNIESFDEIYLITVA